MGFSEAVKSAFSKYATFSGRAPRSEYWFFGLFNVLVSIGLLVVFGILGAIFMGDGGFLVGVAIAQVIYYIYCLAVFIPSIAVTVRRLHDINKSGWWWWIQLIPLAGVIVLLVFACTKGTDGENAYGPDPLSWEAA